MGWGNESCSNDPGRMTKMAATPIYGKNIQNSSSPEPKGQGPWDLGTTKLVQMMTLG